MITSLKRAICKYFLKQNYNHLRTIPCSRLDIRIKHVTLLGLALEDGLDCACEEWLVLGVDVLDTLEALLD